jgi:hypothetical protein
MNEDIYNIVAPALIVAAMSYFLLKRKRLRKKGYSAIGEITGFEGTGDERYPIIRFKTVTGELIEKKYRVGAGRKEKVGNQVPLFYDPLKPTEFIIDRKQEQQVAIAILVLSILFSIAYFTFFRSRQ